MKKWYVLHVVSGGEDLYKRDLLKAVEEASLNESLEEVLVPVRKKIDDSDKETSERIFPGYVLLNADLTPDLLFVITRIPRFFRFAGGLPPKPLSQKELDTIFSSVNKPVEKVVATNVSVGSEVKVVKGPFSGFSGIVEEVDLPKMRVKLVLSIFGRMTSVLVDFDQLEV